MKPNITKICYFVLQILLWKRSDYSLYRALCQIWTEYISSFCLILLKQKKASKFKAKCCCTDLENWDQVTKSIWGLGIPKVDPGTKYDWSMLFCKALCPEHYSSTSSSREWNQSGIWSDAYQRCICSKTNVVYLSLRLLPFGLITTTSTTIWSKNHLVYNTIWSRTIKTTYVYMHVSICLEKWSTSITLMLIYSL